MAVTIVNKGRSVQGNTRVRFVDITGPGSYTSPGGEALSASDLAALTQPGGKITDIVGFDAETSTAGHSVVLDRTNSKIKYFNGTTEIANAVSLSGVTIRAQVVYGLTNS